MLFPEIALPDRARLGSIVMQLCFDLGQFSSMLIMTFAKKRILVKTFHSQHGILVMWSGLSLIKPMPFRVRFPYL